MVAAVLFVSLPVACSGSGSRSGPGPGFDLAALPGAGDEARLVGAGSTFVANLVRGWSEQYSASVPGVRVEYEPVGSPAAVKRLRDRSVDFATSDLPLTDLQEVLLGGSEEIAQVPWAAGAIAIVYNLGGIDELRLRPDVLAAILTGQIQRWNDPAIRADNPRVSLPNLAIQVVHRSDPSGTTALFSAYMKAAAPDSWGLLTGTTVNWPRGIGAEGSAALAAAVARNPGAIGYAQLSYAGPAGLGVARLQNRAGRFVAPTTAGVQAALAAAEGRRFEATFDLYFLTEAPSAYPLSTVSYLLYRRDLDDPAKAVALRHFAEWALGEGQRSAERLGYAPVPLAIAIPALAVLQGRA